MLSLWAPWEKRWKHRGEYPYQSMIGFKKYIEGKANKNNTNYVCRSQCKSRKQSVFIERRNCSTIAWWRHPFQNGFFPFSIPRTKNEDYAKRILIQLTFSNVTVVVSFLVLEWQNNIFFFGETVDVGIELINPVFLSNGFYRRRYEWFHFLKEELKMLQ